MQAWDGGVCTGGRPAIIVGLSSDAQPSLSGCPIDLFSLNCTPAVSIRVPLLTIIVDLFWLSLPPRLLYTALLLPPRLLHTAAVAYQLSLLYTAAMMSHILSRLSLPHSRLSLPLLVCLWCCCCFVVLSSLCGAVVALWGCSRLRGCRCRCGCHCRCCYCHGGEFLYWGSCPSNPLLQF
jgi:hypothetical protein